MRLAVRQLVLAGMVLVEASWLPSDRSLADTPP
jgi:hypothetical protein